MISSVVAKLNGNSLDRQQTVKLIEEISSHPSIELGVLVDCNGNLPLTIDAAGNQEAEEITRWIMSLDGVNFVDVVFVHMEDDDVSEKPIRKSRNSCEPSKS